MATKDEKGPAHAVDAVAGASPHNLRAERRRRAHELLERPAAQLDRLEHEVAERFEQLAAEVARELTGNEEQRQACIDQRVRTEESARWQEQLDALRQQLAARAASADETLAELAEARASAARLEHELRVSQALVQEAHDRDESIRLDVVVLKEQLADAQAQLAAARDRQSELRHELATERERAASQQEQSAAEIARLTAETKRSAEESECLAAQMQAAATEPAASAALDEELKVLRAECQRLTKELAQAARPAPPAAATDSRPFEDLKRRFEMAMEDLRNAKQANAALEARQSEVAKGGRSQSSENHNLDWESQKQRLLAALEADERGEEAADEEHLALEAMIRSTDEAVAKKDVEIADLKRQLELVQGSPSSATAEVLDRDEVIREERQRLADLERQWREKFGQAEIDISIERAKVARERAELEDRLRQLSDRDRSMRGGERAGRAGQGQHEQLALQAWPEGSGGALSDGRRTLRDRRLRRTANRRYSVAGRPVV